MNAFEQEVVIEKIYSKFQVLPNIQEHMLRVASLVEIYLELMGEEVLSSYFKLGSEEIIFLALVHDLGKFVGIDLDYTNTLYPGLLNKRKVSKLKALQKKFIKKFGASSHYATFKMLRELGVSPLLCTLASLVGFINAPFALKYGIYELMLVIYADQRVGPHSIKTLKERTAEGFKRHIKGGLSREVNNQEKQRRILVKKAEEEYEYVLSVLYEIEGVLLDVNPRFKRIYSQTKMLNLMAGKRAPDLLTRILYLRH